MHLKQPIMADLSPAALSLSPASGSRTARPAEDWFARGARAWSCRPALARRIRAGQPSSRRSLDQRDDRGLPAGHPAPRERHRGRRIPHDGLDKRPYDVAAPILETDSHGTPVTPTRAARSTRQRVVSPGGAALEVLDEVARGEDVVAVRRVAVGVLWEGAPTAVDEVLRVADALTSASAAGARADADLAGVRQHRVDRRRDELDVAELLRGDVRDGDGACAVGLRRRRRRRAGRCG